MKKRLEKIFRPVYPTPAALITSVDAEGKRNIITLGEVFNISLSKPPVVGVAIRKATYSHGLISASREFGVNLPSRRIIEQTDYCGTHSGRDVDKFERTGLTPIPATLIKPPLIELHASITCDAGIGRSSALARDSAALMTVSSRVRRAVPALLRFPRQTSGPSKAPASRDSAANRHTPSARLRRESSSAYAAE